MQPTKIKTVAPKKIRYRQTKPEQLYSLSDALNGVPIPEEEVSPEEKVILDKLLAELYAELDAGKSADEIGVPLSDFDKVFGL